MHVFSDLKPYICTFPECSLELLQFSTRAQWADHEFSCHRFVEDWCCSFCSTTEIHDQQNCEQHLERSHGVQQPELAYWVNRARTKRARMMNVEECLLCRTFPAESRQAFIKHCCQHMEEIALMAMPQIADDGSEGDEDSPEDDRSTQSSWIIFPSPVSHDANHNSRKTGAPTVAPVNFTDSTVTEFTSTIRPGDLDPSIGDQERSEIVPIPKLPGGSQIKKKRSRTTPEEASHECRVCGKLFKRAHNYKNHMETHNPDRKYPHPCTAMLGNQQCTKKLLRKTDLDRHYDSVHLKARNHRCILCGNRFARRDTLRKYVFGTNIICSIWANPSSRHTEEGGCPKRPGFVGREIGFRGATNSSQTALDQKGVGSPETFPYEDAALKRQTPERSRGYPRLFHPSIDAALKQQTPGRTKGDPNLDHPDLDEQGHGPSSRVQSKYQATAPRWCSNCNTRQTPRWLPGLSGPSPVCNRCGLGIQ